MSKFELLSALQALHQQLAQTEEVDPDTRQALQQVMLDIQRVVDGPDPSVADSTTSESHESLSQKMMDAVNEFEARHPQVASLINNVADRLSDLGI